jgi:putative N-acetylmannosamine-6-phosphate epimerase
MNNTGTDILFLDMTSQVFPLLNAIQLLTGAENYPQWCFAMEDILTLTKATSYHFNGMDIVNGRWNITATIHVAPDGKQLSQTHLDENHKIYKQ